MAGSGRVRDSALIDVLEAAGAVPFAGTVWRLVHDGRDPTQCSSAGGRWDDRSFDVLYTASDRDGAIAEMYFHLSRGLPVMPSRVRYRLFELSVDLPRLLDLPTLDHLVRLGHDVATFGQLSYDERVHEYPRTQDIAEVAHFLDYSGMRVPSARHSGTNVVVFCDRVRADAMVPVRDEGIVDWESWRRDRR
jgi:RES domain-containing protein